jgi:hypothetical protein
MIFHYDPMASPPLRVNQKSPGTQPTYRPGTEVCPEGILEKNQGMKDSGFQAYSPHITRQERGMVDGLPGRGEEDASRANL